MVMNAVTSSMILRAGYDPELKHLRVVMADGSGYDVAPCSAAEFAFFMDAPSKGSYWHKVFAGRAYRSGDKEANAADQIDGAQAAPSGHERGAAIKLREPEPPRLTHASLAEGCCAKHFGKASLSGTLDRLQPWECPKCSTTYWPKQVGPLVNWEARADALVFKV